MRETLYPAAVANSASKDTSVIGRRRPQISASASTAARKMTIASCRSIPAVDPRRNPSSPACRPDDIDWITVSSTIPKPKNTPSTAPIAASSVRRVRATIHWMRSSPTAALMAEPSSRPSKVAPVSAQRHHDDEGQAHARKGGMRDRVGHSARLRRSRKVPVAPAAKPSSAGADRDERGVVARLKQKRVDKRGQARDPGQRQLVDMGRRKPAAIGRRQRLGGERLRHGAFGDRRTLIRKTRSKYSATVDRS
jgi:hypothetical protein